MADRRTRSSVRAGAGAVALAGVLVLAACGDDGDEAAADAGGDADVEEQVDVEAPEEAETAAAPGCAEPEDDQPVVDDEGADNGQVGDGAALDELDLSLTEIGQFESPTALINRPGDTDLFVTERAGRVIRIEVEGDGVDRTYTAVDGALLDITDEVVDEGYEQGLLNLTFSPSGDHLYVSYTADGETEGGDSLVTAYTYDPDTGTVDEDSRREILVQRQPYPEHNGGDIFFGPDGCLYVALGDGTPVGDAYENGQDTSSLLGSILRIDPEAAWDTDDGYHVPADNPLVEAAAGTGDDDDADDGPRSEIWIYGVRNPWRSSFDPVTGDLWVADVGEHAWEEINFLPAGDDGEEAGRGANLGWSDMEANEPFNGDGNPDGAILPVHTYSHEEEGGVSVTGGVVYRGAAVEGLDGAYLFGDWVEPRLRALTVDGDAGNDDAGNDDAGHGEDGNGWAVTWFDGIEVPGLVSFGVDTEGEVYLVSLEGPIHRLDPGPA